MSGNPKAPRQVNVAIIGAGCAGLYCAWRLAKDKKTERTICVFEKEGRVGGRLLSVDLLSPLIPDLPRKEMRKAELGGMRFTANQLLINKVIDKLQVDVDLPRKDGPLNRKEYNFSSRLMYLRKVRLGSDRTTWPNVLPYKALEDDHEIGDIATGVAKAAIRETFWLMGREKAPKGAEWKRSVSDLLKKKDDLRKTTLDVSRWRDWQVEAKFKGKNIYEFGFEHLIRDVTEMSISISRKHPGRKPLAIDTAKFLVDSLGYQSLISDSNAAQSIPIFLADFDNPPYSTLAGGMDALPRMLAYQCKEERHPIATRHAVKSIEWIADGKYFELDVICTPFSDHEPRYQETWRAEKVILALPQEALQKITFGEGFPTLQYSAFQKNLEQVEPHTAAKLFLRYNKPWWKDLALEKVPKGELPLEARVITDEPIRQVYYYATKDDEPAFIMGYCDGAFSKFWIDNAPKWERHVSMQAALGMNSVLAASPKLIDDAEAILKEIHGHGSIPKSTCGVMKQWRDAWHFWKANVQPWDVAEKLIRPFEGIDLFTCGEAYSLEQGWVEGALKSAERVLSEMGLEGWIDDGECQKYGCDDFKQYIEH